MIVKTDCKIALIGCGHWGQYILRDLRILGCHVIVVARSAESRRRAEEGGAFRIVSCINELPPVEGIIIATSTKTHASLLEEALHFRVPIFVEKPLTCDSESARLLASKGEGRIFVMDKWRYHAGILKLAEIARDEELGPVIGLRSKRLQWGYPHDRRDVDAVWMLTPHDLSIALEIFGYLPAPRHAVAEKANGQTTSLIAIMGDHPWFHCEVSVRSPLNKREIKLHCRDGIAVLPDSYSDHLQIIRGSIHDTAPSEEKRPIDNLMPLLEELKAFIHHLEGGPVPKSSAEEGANIVKTIDALRRLAQV